MSEERCEACEQADYEWRTRLSPDWPRRTPPLDLHHALIRVERERVKRLEAALRLAAARFGSMSERMEEDGAENLQGWASECIAGGSEIHATLTEAEP